MQHSHCAKYWHGVLVACCAWATGNAIALDINQASEADLDSLKGVGPATTQRILAERGQAPFSSWADLMARVKGLRPPTARKLSGQGLTVNGTSFDEDPPRPQPAVPNPPPPGV